MSALKTKLVNIISIRTSPRALWNALTRPQFTRQYYVGLELTAGLKRGGRFDYMHRAELHGRPGAGVEGVVIEVIPRKKLVNSFAPEFIDVVSARAAYATAPIGFFCKPTLTHNHFPHRRS